MTSTYVSQEKIQEKNVRWLVSHELFSTRYKRPQHEIKGPKFDFIDKHWRLELCLKPAGNVFESTTLRLITDCKCDADIRLEIATITPTWVKVLWYGFLLFLAWWMSGSTYKLYIITGAAFGIAMFRNGNEKNGKKKKRIPEAGPGGYLWDLDTNSGKLLWGTIFYQAVMYFSTFLGTQWSGNLQTRAIAIAVGIYVSYGDCTRTWVEKVVRFKEYHDKRAATHQGTGTSDKTVWKLWLGFTWYLRMTASPEHEIRLRIRVRSCETTGVFPRKKINSCENIVRDMVSNEQGTDVTLRTKDGDEVKAHATFLTYHSEVFKKMLSPGSFHEGIDGVVELRDVTSEHLRALIEFCYFGHIAKDLVCELFKLADKYLITSLREGCFDIMKAERDPAAAIAYIQTLRCFRDDMGCRETALELLALIRSSDIKTAFVRETMSTWSKQPEEESLTL